MFRLKGCLAVALRFIHIALIKQDPTVWCGW
jgi:hypothetical protein